MTSQLYNSIVTAIYQVNYDYYAQELCENQDKPELHCDGKCYFAKQLTLAENNTKSEPPVLLPTLRLFSEAQTDFAPSPIFEEDMPKIVPHNFFLPKTHFYILIEHPPQV